MLEAVASPDGKRTLNLGLTRSDLWVGALLALVILLGGYFRFVGQNWDDFVRWHPDERFLSGVAAQMGGPLNFTDVEVETQYANCLARYPDTGGRGGFFDAQCSPMNPHNTGSGLYVYGTLPSFLVRWTADALIPVFNLRDCLSSADPKFRVEGKTSFECFTGSAIPPTTQNSVWGTYTAIQLIGRAISALADMLVILVVFFIGVRLHGKWVGLLAALLYACAPFPIQQSHFWTSDAIANLFCVLTIWAAIRVQDTGKLGSYLEFGLFFGAALASRINTAPLVGLLLLAVVVRLLPLLDAKMSWNERGNALTNAVGGLVLAGTITILTFRIFNPYAFTGPGFFGLTPNPRWLKDIAQAQYLVSGDAESPPNWQWAGRTRYLFPFMNMNLWGMGILLGAAGWLSWAWSGWRLIRGKAGALRNLLPFVWILVYFGWLGNLWVMSMRYYLPMYAVFALLAAWGLVELVQQARKTEAIWRKVVAWGALASVTAFTLLWGVMFTNIYRHQMTTAQSTHWVSENLPADFSMQIEGTDAPLINIAVPNRAGGDTPLDVQASSYEEGQPYTQTFVASADGVVRSVYSPHLGDPNGDPEPETLRVRISPPDSNIVLAEGLLTSDLKRDNSVLGDPYTIAFDQPFEVQKGQSYNFTVEVMSGGQVISAGPVFAWEGEWDEVSLPKTCKYPADITQANDPPSGLSSPLDCAGLDLWYTQLHSEPLQIYYDESTFKRDLMQQGLDNSDYLIISTNRRYDSQSRIPYRWPMTMRYYDALFSGKLGFELVKTFEETFELGPLKVSDQYLPTYNGPKWLNEFEAEEAFHVYDHPTVFIFRKTESYSSANTHAVLDGVTLNQINAAQQLWACPQLTIDTQSPAGYFCDPTIVDVVPLYSVPASSVPTLLKLPPDLATEQFTNGTWSDRFHSDSVINTQPVVTLLGWWFTMMVFGWVTWPLLFVIFPGLADRGYAFAKAAGLLLVAWLAWVFSSARIPLWSQSGIITVLVGLALVSLFLIWRNRADFFAYVRENMRQMLWIEAITLLVFAAFLVVRLSNPDLWHFNFGGEKPMDFAYFNGVLRSTVFPPIDPWYAGGYINYYYFGYVIVGSPVLLLGVMPSIAYNLILPTLFSLAGMAAFSVAFNVVSALREKVSDAEVRAINNEFGLTEVASNTASLGKRRLGNPWVAGIAAMVLAMVLGNLDTPRVFVTEGLMNMGGYNQPYLLQDQLIRQYTADHNGQAPQGDDLVQIMNQSVEAAASPFESAWRGLQNMLAGNPLNVAPNRWYWAPTRLIAEPSNNTDAAIAEFPFFTFLYGDLHAHMIAMPLLFMAMAFVLNEVLVSGEDRRSRFGMFVALLFGAITIGMLRATNTWDWITFMLLGVLGLGFAWWLSLKSASTKWGDWSVQQASSGMRALGAPTIWRIWWRIGYWVAGWGLTRRALVTLIARVGGFVGLAFLVALPYSTWYSAVYNRALPWTGPHTAIWQYLTVYGTFLFLLFSLLLWDTGRWLRSVYVRQLRGQCLVLVAAVLMIVLILLGALVLSGNAPVTIIAVPFLVWIAILFLRQGQTREMRYVLALAGLAIGLSLGVEYIVLDGDIGRQNTLFKFYIQAWLLLSAVGGVAVAWLVAHSGYWPTWIRGGWYTIACLLLAVGAMYPMMASRGRSLDRMTPQPPLTLSDIPLTLDGMAYMQYSWLYEGDPNLIQNDPSVAPFSLADDYAMIRWMQENIQGTPTIMEGQSDREYRWEGRVAIYTGFPAVIGWNFHQRQQRTFDPLPRLVQQRVSNVNAFYVTTDIQTAYNILQHYDVSYVVVSSLEKAYYPPTSLAKFADMVDRGLLEVVYAEGEATVYKVVKNAQFDLNEDVAGGV